VNYILAGKDSTSAAICWTMYMLVLHPEVTAKVRQELADLVQQKSPPRDGSDHGLSEKAAIEAFAELLTFDNVNSLNYLHAVITEVMRLYPPLPLNSKEAVADDILPDGTIVRKGDAVVFHAYGMGRMPYIWGSDASDFKPERWIKDGVFQPESHFKYIAFQGGPRLCLGKDSSYLQMKISVALLTQFFDFQLVPGHRYGYKAMISLIFADGLPVIINKRKTYS
jgi:cytochrome P450